MSRRRLDGLLLLDKPRGLTSNAALQRAKRLFRAEKAGHAGTLDPLATGLLPVLFGEASKFAARLLDSEKAYEAEVQLGVATTTGDAEGEVTARQPVAVSDAELELALSRFRGPIVQVPPMHSALKHGGRPLYALAREGLVVERAPRRVVVSELALLARRADTLALRVRCSKGTYIRSLAIDLGNALGTGAHLTVLRRTAAGGFRIADAIGLDALEAMDEAQRDRRILPLQVLFAGLPVVRLDAVAAARFGHGQAVPAAAAPGECQVIDPAGALIGLGAGGDDGMLRPVRLLAARPAAPNAAASLKNLVS